MHAVDSRMQVGVCTVVQTTMNNNSWGANSSHEHGFGVQRRSIDSRGSQKTKRWPGSDHGVEAVKNGVRQESTREQGSHKNSKYANNGERRCQTFDALLPKGNGFQTSQRWCTTGREKVYKESRGADNAAVQGLGAP